MNTTDEDHVVQLKAQEKASKWTMSRHCFASPRSRMNYHAQLWSWMRQVRRPKKCSGWDNHSYGALTSIDTSPWRLSKLHPTDEKHVKRLKAPEKANEWTFGLFWQTAKNIFTTFMSSASYAEHNLYNLTLVARRTVRIYNASLHVNYRLKH